MNKKSFSIKILLLWLIIFGVSFFYLFYSIVNLKLNDNWIPKSELQSDTTLNTIDDAYIYCNSYDNIKSDKFTSKLIVLVLWCSTTTLLILLIFSLRKIKKQKEEYELTIKKEREKIILASKFTINDFDLEAQQILSDEFKKNIYSIFCELQIACMNFDYPKLKTLLTPKLYDKYCNGLKILESKSRKNIVSDIEFVNLKFIESKEENDRYSVKVQLDVKFYGYLKDIKTNKILRGTNETKTRDVYKLHLIKYKSYADNCEKCGAPNTNNLVDTCEYCKSKLISKSSNWIVAEKEKINEK